jgi:dienelactone hydrolase
MTGVLAGVALCAVLTAAGCAGNDSGGTPAGTASPAAAGTATPPTTTLPPLRPPSERCSASPEPAAQAIRLTTEDGVHLSAAVAGKGRAGILLLHHDQGDICQTWRYAADLAKRGFQVLALDVRCFGQSECPDGSARGDVLGDVDASLAELRRRGAKEVGIVGGSMGGTMALLAGALSDPRPAAVVSLSGGATDLAALLGGERPLRAEDVASRLRVPVLLMAAPEDNDAVPVNRKLLELIASKDKRLIVLPEEHSGRHGFSMLIDFANVDKFWPAAAEVTSFLRRHVAS